MIEHEILPSEPEEEYDVIIPEKVEYEEEDYELVEVYTENGIDFYFDDLINDFYTFCCYMFVRAGFANPTTIQKMIIYFIAKPSDKDKMIQGPRGCGKSFISQLKVLWDILRDNDNHILVRSASSKRSRNYTTFLLNLIKQTPLLQHMSPTNKHRKSSELFDVNGAKASDSPTVLSAGISGAVTGLRATLCVLDDVEIVSNANTPETRETLNDQINENYNLLVESNGISGEVLVLGTFQTGDSVYIPMIQSGSFEHLIIPAEYPPVNAWFRDMVPKEILQVSIDNPDMIGKAIDERLNDKFLAKRKLRAGKSNYELHYMLNPILEDSLRFPLKLKDLMVVDIDMEDNPIKYVYSAEEKLTNIKHRGFTGDNPTKPAWTSTERMPFDFTILAIDPSGKGSDETGYCVVSLVGSRIFIREFGGLQGGYEDEALDTLVALAIKYNVNRVTAESNFGDGAYLKMLEAKLEKEHRCETKDVRAVGQKEVRIIDTLEPLMNQHRIVVSREALERDFDKSPQYTLTYQLTHITRAKGCLTHDDIIDVWELGVRDMVEFMGRDDSHTMDRYKKKKAIDYEKFMQKNALVPALYGKGTPKRIQDNY